MKMGEKKMAEHVGALYTRMSETRSRYFRDHLEEGMSRQEEGIILLQAAANFFRVTVVTEIDIERRAHAVQSMCEIILANLSDESVSPGEILEEHLEPQTVLDDAAKARDSEPGIILQ